MEIKPRAVKPFNDDCHLKEDMERYREEALKLGASDARIIRAEDAIVDERVRLKCLIPRCFEYDMCAYCPPHSPTAAQVKEIMKSFRYGLLVKIDVEPHLMAGEDLAKALEETRMDKDGYLKETLKKYAKIFEIVAKVESMGFYDGYHLACGFSAGSCNVVFCGYQPCEVLKGNKCRSPLKARPSMEASGFDVFKMAASQGWNIYPIGAECKPDTFPQGTLLGLVMID